MDDEHTMFFSMGARRTRSTPRRTAIADRVAIAGRRHAAEYDRLVRPVPAGGERRQRLPDRSRQAAPRARTTPGIAGIHTQDQAITESMGPIYDRRTEHLGTSDVMVIRVRRRLLEAARALGERGVTPPGVDDPELYGVRSGGAFLPEGADWLEGHRGAAQGVRGASRPGSDDGGLARWRRKRHASAARRGPRGPASVDDPGSRVNHAWRTSVTRSTALLGAA